MDDQLNSLLKKCQQGLFGALADSQHAWRLFTVANVDAEGLPQSRYVVLRDWLPDSCELTFFTDQRSSKISDIALKPSISLSFFDPTAHLQLVVQGEVTLHNQDSIAEKYWQASHWRSLKCYQMKESPGEILPVPFMLKPEDLSEEDAYQFFTVATCRNLSWDVLLLKPEGNQRAIFGFDKEGVLTTGNWLAP